MYYTSQLYLTTHIIENLSNKHIKQLNSTTYDIRFELKKTFSIYYIIISSTKVTSTQTGFPILGTLVRLFTVTSQ